MTLPDLASPGPCGAQQVQGTQTELLGGAGSTLRAEEQASVKREVAFSGVRRLARRTNGARVFSDQTHCSAVSVGVRQAVRAVLGQLPAYPLLRRWWVHF